MGNEINIALLQMLPGKDITENMEKGIIIYKIEQSQP